MMKILIADDEEMQRDLLKGFLKGCEVMTVENAVMIAACSAVKGRKTDVQYSTKRIY